LVLTYWTSHSPGAEPQLQGTHVSPKRYSISSTLSTKELRDCIEKGEKEIRYAFKDARPLWPKWALNSLPRQWADQVSTKHPEAKKERARLAQIKPGSDAFYEELEKRYGLHRAPFENDGLPLGLTQTKQSFVPGQQKTYSDFIVLPGREKRVRRRKGSWTGITVNCQLCHSGSFFTGNGKQGKVAPGTSNVFMDFQRLHEDLSRVSAFHVDTLLKRNPPRNSMVNFADYFARILVYTRPNAPNPSLDKLRLFNVFGERNNIIARRRQGEFNQLKADTKKFSYIKTQPWITYASKLEGVKNQGFYVDGGFHGNFANVTYGNAFSLKSDGSDYRKAAERFQECVPDYFKSLKAPRYPMLESIDATAADRGHAVFQETCARCHGEYERKGERDFSRLEYPGVIVPIAEIGTDSHRVSTPEIAQFEKKRDALLQGKVERTGGYTAPPLEGIWIRGPYPHNASVPTLDLYLRDPKERPTRYGISPASNDSNNYDHEKGGWKFVDLSNHSKAELDALKAKDPYTRIYDPSFHPGLENVGHSFGTPLSEAERRDVIQFLLTL